MHHPVFSCKIFMLAMLAVLLGGIYTPVKGQEYPNCVVDIGMPIYGNGGNINITDLPANLPPVFGIVGTLIVNQSSTWTQKQVIMFGGSQIKINAGKTFELSGTVLEGCDQMWKGVFMGGGGSILLTGGSRISDAVSAVESRGENTIFAQNVSLTRNFYGLNFYNCSTSIFLEVYNLTIDGAGPLKLPYTGQPANLYGPRGRAGLLLTNLALFGSPFTTETNVVKNYEVGAWIVGCAGGLFDFRFEDIIWYHANKPLGTAVLIQNGIPNHPDGILVSACDFINCNTGIDAFNSRVTFQEDIMTTVNTGIRVRNALPNEGSQIYDCVITGTNHGIMLGPNPNAIVHLEGNIIHHAATYGIYVTDQTTAVNQSRYTIERCTITIKGNEALSPRNNDDAIGIWATQLAAQGQNIKIQSNYVYLPGTNTSPGNAGIYVTQSHSLVIRKNHVIQDTPNASAAHTGMFYENTNYTTIECNDFLNTDKGLVVSGAQNTPTAIRTNQFKYHTSVGMLFKGGVTQSLSNPPGDHVHQGNLWLYPTDATNPGAVSELAGAANEFMQFIVDNNENPAFYPFVVGDNWFVTQQTPGATPTCDPYSAFVGNNPSASANRSDGEPDTPAADLYEVNLSAFPNPSSGDVTVSWNDPAQNWSKLEMYSATGQVVYSTAISEEERAGHLVRSLQPGLYLCRLIRADGRSSQGIKILVH